LLIIIIIIIIIIILRPTLILQKYGLSVVWCGQISQGIKMLTRKECVKNRRQWKFWPIIRDILETVQTARHYQSLI